MANIQVANLDLNWSLTSWVKPTTPPPTELFKTVKNIKITWISETLGTVSLPKEDVNYMLFDGEYYFLRKQEVLDPGRKRFTYTVIKDLWMSIITKKINVKGTLIKTNNEKTLWDNLQFTTPLTTNLSGLTRLNYLGSTTKVSELMKNVEIYKTAKNFKTTGITKQSYETFLNGIIENTNYKLTTSNHTVVISKLKATEIDSWQNQILNVLNSWLDENKHKLIIGSVTGTTLGKAGPNLAEEIKTYRDNLGIDNTINKVIKSEGSDGILSSTKEDSYIEYINLSNLTGIKQIWPIENVSQQSRLAIELFDVPTSSQEKFKTCYLRPKLYTQSGIQTKDSDLITKTLKLAPTPNKLNIVWNKTELTKYKSQNIDFLEDWANGGQGPDSRDDVRSYIDGALQGHIYNRRVGFAPGVFSTEFKDKLVRGIYTPTEIGKFSFVNGLQLKGQLLAPPGQMVQETVETYLVGRTPIDVMATVLDITWHDKYFFNRVGQDLSLYIKYNDFSSNRVGEHTYWQINTDEQKNKEWKNARDVQHKLRKSIETVVDVQTEILSPGTLVVNNISYGFYEFATEASANTIEQFQHQPTDKEVDLSDNIVLISEPRDVTSAGFQNIANNLGYGIRRCKTEEYEIAPTNLMVNFTYKENINKTSVSTFTRMLEKESTADANAIHTAIVKYMNGIISEAQEYKYTEYFIASKFNVKINYSAEKWLKQQVATSKWQTKGKTIIAGGIYTTEDNYLNFKQMKAMWPKKDGKYILPKEVNVYTAY